MAGRTIAVIGGGVAGIAAALAAADRGAQVTLYESLPQLGGRAAGADGIDTGRHLVLSCYRDFFRLLRRIGSDRAVELHPLVYHALAGDATRTVEFPGGEGRHPKLASRLLAGSLLPVAQRIPALAALAQTTASAPGEADDGTLAGDGRTRRIRITGGGPVTDAWRRLHWPHALVARFGSPLAAGIGNAPPHAWAAGPFLNALARVLDDPDPRAGWVSGERYGTVISEPARRALIEADVDLRRGEGVRWVERVPGGWRVAGDRAERFDRAICAVQPARLDVLAQVAEARPLLRAAARVTGRTILTARAHVYNLAPRHGPHGEADPPHAFWFAEPHPDGGVLLERVISGLPDENEPDPDEQRRAFQHGARRWFGVEVNHGEISARHYPSATPTLAPGGPRPAIRHGPGLFYASDWCATGLPATLESAARAGFLAGRLAADQSTTNTVYSVSR